MRKIVLTVIRKAGIDIPTLCYHSELSTFGACRLCTVEDDRGRTFASCSEEPRDGMVIYTNTGKLKRYRKLIIELLTGGTLQRLYDLCQERRLQSADTGTPFWRDQCTIRTTTESRSRLISVLRPSCVIRINVFCVVTAYVSAMSCRG